MKKALIISVAVIIPLLLSAQEDDSKRPAHIRGGLYLKAGLVIPVGLFAEGQSVPFIPKKNPLPYLPANPGAAFDLGFLFYLGPSFANHTLRAGIDATFLSTWFCSTSPPDKNDWFYKYYTFIGQKFGPVITINPVNRLMIDLSYKLNANLAYHEELDGWDPLSSGQTSSFGYNLFNQEVSLGLRYTILALSFQYNFGTMNYNDADKNNIDQKINIDSFRILFGFKF
jgi:hypothetical protein